MKELTAVENFLQEHENRLAFEQERLLVEATELISRLLDEKSVTKSSLAKRVGKSKAYITQTLRGETNMTLKSLASFLFALERRLELRAMPLKSMSTDLSWGGDKWIQRKPEAEDLQRSYEGSVHRDRYRHTEDPKVLQLMQSAA